MPAGACLPRPPRRPVIQPPYLPESNLPVEFILETRGLTKEFKGFVAVNNVDLKVQRGHIHALIGPTAPARPPSSTC
jgi:ABC-type glutathione transport system ATPase component